MKLLLLLLFIVLSCANGYAVKPESTDIQTIVPVSKRVAEMIVPRVEYRESSVADAVVHLNKLAKDLDPNKVGVRFELTPAAKRDETRITISVSNVPLIELVKYITSLANLRYEITATKVLIKTVGDK